MTALKKRHDNMASDEATGAENQKVHNAPLRRPIHCSEHRSPLTPCIYTPSIARMVMISPVHGVQYADGGASDHAALRCLCAAVRHHLDAVLAARASSLASGEQTVSELAEQRGFERTTLTRNLDRLEKMGLDRVTRRPSMAMAGSVRSPPRARRWSNSCCRCWRKAQAEIRAELGADGFDRYPDDTAAARHHLKPHAAVAWPRADAV